MKRRTQQCIAAFAITVIAIGALCGFVLVDLSTERYMPSDYGPLFLVTNIDADGVLFSAMGVNYKIGSGQFDGVRDALWRLRGMLPGNSPLAAYLTAKGYFAVQDYRSDRHQTEEPW